MLVRLAFDDVGKGEIQAQLPGTGAATLKPLTQDIARRRQPRRSRRVDRPRRQRRALRDDERIVGQRAQVLEHHRSALAMQRHRDQLLKRPIPAALGAQLYPPPRGAVAGRQRAIAVNPRHRVGAIEPQPMTKRQPAREGRLAGARRPTDPHDIHTRRYSAPGSPQLPLRQRRATQSDLDALSDRVPLGRTDHGRQAGRIPIPRRSNHAKGAAHGRCGLPTPGVELRERRWRGASLMLRGSAQERGRSTGRGS
jgi:hypothetical protein